jgi:hypothetical protein
MYYWLKKVRCWRHRMPPPAFRPRHEKQQLNKEPAFTESRSPPIDLFLHPARSSRPTHFYLSPSSYSTHSILLLPLCQSIPGNQPKDTYIPWRLHLPVLPCRLAVGSARLLGKGLGKSRIRRCWSTRRRHGSHDRSSAGTCKRHIEVWLFSSFW